jgi:PhnB protein
MAISNMEVQAMNIQTPGSDLPETNIAPWLTVNNAMVAVDYYKAAFGANEIYRLENDNGSLAVAQLTINGANFWINEDPEFSPEWIGRGSVRMIMTVKDPDSVFEQCVTAGATVVSPISEEYGWRIGRIVDPFGYNWEIGKKEDVL